MKGIIALVTFMVLFVGLINTNLAYAGQKFKSSKKQLVALLILQDDVEMTVKITSVNRAKVLESLKKDENIEIDGMIIEPSQILAEIWKRLTDKESDGKRPNQGDY